MFPLKNDNPVHTLPVFTIGIVAANILIFFYQVSLPGVIQENFIFQYGLTPIALTHFSEFADRLPVSIWLTPLTSLFLHGGLRHVLGNMLYLWIFGRNVEEYLGHFKFLVFYILSGLAAAALFVAFNADGRVPLVGASGAVAPTLAYDAAVMGEEAAVPTKRASQGNGPTLVMDGGASEWSFMHTTALALAKAIPHAQHRTLEGQTHDVAPEVLAPALIEFFQEKS